MCHVSRVDRHVCILKLKFYCKDETFNTLLRIKWQSQTGPKGSHSGQCDWRRISDELMNFTCMNGQNIKPVCKKRQREHLQLICRVSQQTKAKVFSLTVLQGQADITHQETWQHLLQLTLYVFRNFSLQSAVTSSFPSKKLIPEWYKIHVCNLKAWGIWVYLDDIIIHYCSFKINPKHCKKTPEWGLYFIDLRVSREFVRKAVELFFVSALTPDPVEKFFSWLAMLKQTACLCFMCMFY